jgi:hypothetical protein
MEEDKKPKTPSQSTFKEGKGSENSNKECCESNTKITIKLQHQEECGSPSYVCDYKHTYKLGL